MQIKVEVKTNSANIVVVNSNSYQTKEHLFVEMEVVGNQMFNRDIGDDFITIEYDNIQISEQVLEVKLEPFK